MVDDKAFRCSTFDGFKLTTLQIRKIAEMLQSYVSLVCFWTVQQTGAAMVLK